MKTAIEAGIGKPGHALREIVGPIGETLAEAILIHEDLKSSFRSLKIWIDRYAGQVDLTDDDRAIALSLFRDAIVQFIGCFGAKPPKLQVELVYAGQDGADRYFTWLKDVRDSYAAHNFGALRQCVVGIIVDDDGAMIGNGHMLNIYQGPESDGAPNVLGFIGLAIKYVESQIGRLGGELVALAEQMSPQQRLSLPVARTYGTDPAEVRITRERLKAKRG